MRSEWYGDKRDLVKWGTLVHLCQEHGIKKIIQVPFLAKESGCDLMLLTDDNQVDFPRAVWQHFRDIKQIDALGKSIGLDIKVVPDEFSHQKRSNYFERIQVLAQSTEESKVVFLDPDTGLEPEKCKAKHVSSAEIRAIWHCLRPGDLLALYQHASRQQDLEKKAAAEV
jgi:hypothetical protein